MTIIGWDDNYPKENFIEGHQPSENGAWLVKNSWGSGELDFPYHVFGTWGIQVPKLDENGNPVLDENGEPVTVGSGYFWLSYYDRSLMDTESFEFEPALAPQIVDQHDYMPVSGIEAETASEPAMMANVFRSDCSKILKRSPARPRRT